MRNYNNHSDIITYVILTIVFAIAVFNYLPNAISSGSIIKITICTIYIIIYIVAVVCKVIETKNKGTRR